MSRLAKLRKQNEKDRNDLVHFNEHPSQELMNRVLTNKNVWREHDDSVLEVFRRAASSLYDWDSDEEFTELYQKILIELEAKPSRKLIDQTGILYFVSGMKIFLEHLVMVAGMAGGTYKDSSGKECDRRWVKESIRKYALDVYRSIQKSYGRPEELNVDGMDHYSVHHS